MEALVGEGRKSEAKKVFFEASQILNQDGVGNGRAGVIFSLRGGGEICVPWGNPANRGRRMCDLMEHSASICIGQMQGSKARRVKQRWEQPSFF